jgi:hypothetical protein
MFFFSHELQVRNDVICWVFINMVYNFKILQVTPYCSLHNKSMFHDVPFRISHRMFGNTSCSISTIEAVTYQTSFAWLSCLVNYATGKRTVFLISFSGTQSIITTIKAFTRCLYTIPFICVAFSRAIMRTQFTSPLWMEFIPAVCTVIKEVWINHVVILTHHTLYCKLQQRYCEIAANRLRQEVLL